MGSVLLGWGVGTLLRGRMINLLGAAAGGYLIYRSVTGQCPITRLVRGSAVAGKITPRVLREHGVHVEEEIVVSRPIEDIYTYWRRLENLPLFMTHVQSVTALSDTRSRWVVDAPFGGVEWEAEIVHDVPNELISWRSVENATVHNAGTVRFEREGDRQTRVRVLMQYLPIGGRIGAILARAIGSSPARFVRDDLARFKRLMESAVPTTPAASADQPVATGSSF